MTAASLLLPTAQAPGWYGKLATLGDFAQRRLPPDLVQACDTWLSAAMRGGREVLGERWLEVYLTAPVLRFGWAPGAIDGHWWFGVLMPSCDSVGRYYPLLIAQPRSQAPQDRMALDHLQRWYDHLAEAAVRTLGTPEGSVAALEGALQEAPAWPNPGNRAGSGAVHPCGEAAGLRLGRAAPLSEWLQALAAQELRQRLAGCTVWWRRTAGGSDDTLAILRGLPDGASFAHLLAGSDVPAR